MKNMKTMRSLLTASLMLIVPSFAQAQLAFSLLAPNQSAAHGGTLVYKGTLTNKGSAPLFLNGESFLLKGIGLTLDDTPFLTGASVSLGAGGSYTGSLFDVQIAVDAPVQTTLGSFTILGGPNDSSSSDLATARFGVSVMPEPGTLAFLLGAFIAGSGCWLRRRAAHRSVSAPALTRE